MFRRLQKGDTIGLFSPSSPASVNSMQRYERGKAFLEKQGFEVKEGSLTGKSEGYRSGTPKERAEELNQLLRNPDIAMVMSTIGGTNSNSILPYIDYEAFKDSPKIITGYSDVTAILLAMYAKTSVPVFYGPALVPSFGEFPPLLDDTYRFFQQMFMCGQTPYHIPLAEKWSDEPVNWLTKTEEKPLYDNEWTTVIEGTATGRLIGGNTNTMYGFIGTPYFPEIKEGDILLLEDSWKDASVMEKNFAMLKLHGVFEKVSGIILGKHEKFNDLETNKKQYELLVEQLDGLEIPILADFDCSHTHPMHAMPIGGKVHLDATTKEVVILENFLTD